MTYADLLGHILDEMRQNGWSDQEIAVLRFTAMRAIAGLDKGTSIQGNEALAAALDAIGPADFPTTDLWNGHAILSREMIAEAARRCAGTLQAARVFPEFRQDLDRTADPQGLHFRAVDGAATIKPGPMTKFGGQPDWIADDGAHPICCGGRMIFVAQVGSHDIATLDEMQDGAFVFGDAGRLYVFYCERCCISKSILQHA